MTLLLDGQDYVLDSQRQLKSLSGMEEVLQKVLILLTARRGSFPLLPKLGSRLYQLPRRSPAERETLAKQYVLEALEDENELTVTDVALTALDSQTLRIDVSLDYLGQTLSAAVTVQ